MCTLQSGRAVCEVHEERARQSTCASWIIYDAGDRHRTESQTKLMPDDDIDEDKTHNKDRSITERRFYSGMDIMKKKS